jgi:16S rRNA (uracil1498-N3)-methyltransferase
MKRFLVDQDLAEGALITLSQEESRHAVKALRLGPGSAVELTNGKGARAEGTIVSAETAGTVVKVLSVRVEKPSAEIDLLQAPLKGPKMDWLVEKVTEIGVSRILLAQTKYSVAGGEKIDRWQRIAQSAVKQSGNPVMPSIHAAKPLAEALSALGDYDLKVLLQPNAPEGLAEAVKKSQGRKILLAIGPEGGFSAEEELLLQEKGFQPAALSRQILRGETAAIVATAITAHSIDFSAAGEL